LRIGIFGGSFNPVHEGHLKLALEAFSELNLDKVIFVPSFQSPFKTRHDMMPEAVRLRLLKDAVSAYPFFEVSSCELDREGVSYTVDTLKFFRKKYGKDAFLYFLAGADVLKGIDRWKSLDQILKLCRFVILNRAGCPMPKNDQRFLYLSLDSPDISSTAIRKALNKGRVKSSTPSRK
jgi:nicotinate-nucleotide adenylyltransferase